MRADDLDDAIELQNGTPFGLTGGIHSLDEHEVDRWLRAVRVGNAYVNRHITGAIVRRQPFGGWKRSSVGGGPKAGGPHYAAAFTSPPAAPIDIAAARASYAAAWATTYSVDHDPSGLRSEGNVLRYHPLRHVALVVGDDTPPGALDAAVAAAAVCRVRVSVVDGDTLPDGVERLRVLSAGVGDAPLPRRARGGRRRRRRPDQCRRLDRADPLGARAGGEHHPASQRSADRHPSAPAGGVTEPAGSGVSRGSPGSGGWPASVARRRAIGVLGGPATNGHSSSAMRR